MVYGRRNEDDDGEVWKNDVGRRLIKSLLIDAELLPLFHRTQFIEMLSSV